MCVDLTKITNDFFVAVVWIFGVLWLSGASFVIKLVQFKFAVLEDVETWIFDPTKVLIFGKFYTTFD